MKIARFFFLNMYGCLLVFGGLIFIFVPFYKIPFPPRMTQTIIAVIFFLISISLFVQWKDRQRIMVVLRNRNKKEFRPKTFKQWMGRPCTRLLVKAVLTDLNKTEQFNELDVLYGWKTSTHKKQ